MTEPDETNAVSTRAPWPIIAAALGLVAILLGALAIYLYQSDKSPGNDSADVGFARDMSIHHAQAVEMAHIAYRRTQDPEIERIALDIATTQQFQIGMMTGWLDIWGRSVSSDLPLMAWMGDYDMTLPSPPPGLEDDHATMDHSATPAAGNAASGAETPLMPGMATQSQVDELNTLPPDQMDIRFLQLMIRHHQGGVMMAEAAKEKASDTHVLQFAQRVIDTQDAEIATMTDMLNARLAAGSAAPEAGASGTPVAGTPAADMPGMPGMASPTATREGQ